MGLKLLGKRIWLNEASSNNGAATGLIKTGTHFPIENVYPMKIESRGESKENKRKVEEYGSNFIFCLLLFLLFVCTSTTTDGSGNALLPFLFRCFLVKFFCYLWMKSYSEFLPFPLLSLCLAF